jgi:hypothetical protein
VGRLVAVELPPGEYRLNRLVFSSGRQTWSGTSVPDRSFTVVAGKAVYVGQIHTFMKQDSGKDIRYVVGRFDARELDLPLLKEKFAFIQPDRLVYDLPPPPPPSKAKAIDSLPDLTQGINRGLNDLSGLLPPK